MAHFAEIDSNNIVLRVIVVPDSEEANGSEWCNQLLGGTWVQTSYNNRIRKQYAGEGFYYDNIRDEFVAPRPSPSFTLDSENNWQPPVPRPEGLWYWDEESFLWIESRLPSPPVG